MIDEDTYCVDILTQLSAVDSAGESVALGLFDQCRGQSFGVGTAIARLVRT